MRGVWLAWAQSHDALGRGRLTNSPPDFSSRIRGLKHDVESPAATLSRKLFAAPRRVRAPCVSLRRARIHGEPSRRRRRMTTARSSSKIISLISNPHESHTIIADRTFAPTQKGFEAQVDIHAEGRRPPRIQYDDHARQTQEHQNLVLQKREKKCGRAQEKRGARAVLRMGIYVVLSFMTPISPSACFTHARLSFYLPLSLPK